jgi:hypothetical protein
MKLQIEKWSIRELLTKIGLIDYPEFQREPTVWDLDKKQRLIDSMLRGFDISLIYFFKNAKERYDCIDGRQRINAILSYLGDNGSDECDNAFHLKIENEIYDDKGKFKTADSRRFKDLDPKWKEKIYDYKLNIVIIEEIEDDEELNLLFLRLQIASILNAGEKLHAMTGDMREWIFMNISKHKYFQKISIPQRRYAKEQVAAQIVLNEFFKKNTGEFHRSRYIDLQDFFKQYSRMNDSDTKLKMEISSKFDAIDSHFGRSLKYIKNRAIAVSIFLYMSKLIDEKREDDIKTFVDFFVQFMKTLKWQLPKGIDMDLAYRDLLTFQTNISQAAGEKTAIQKRHNILDEYFYHFKNRNEIIGDKQYFVKTKKKPETIRENISL